MAVERTIHVNELMRRLRALRQTIESEQEGLSDEQTTLLVDVCEHVVNLNEEETFVVVGDSFLKVEQGRTMWPAVSVTKKMLGQEAGRMEDLAVEAEFSRWSAETIRRYVDGWKQPKVNAA